MTLCRVGAGFVEPVKLYSVVLLWTNSCMTGKISNGNTKKSTSKTAVTCSPGSGHHFMPKEEEGWCHFFGGSEGSHRWVHSCIYGWAQGLFYEDYQEG